MAPLRFFSSVATSEKRDYEEVLEFVDCGVKTVVQSKASLIAAVAPMRVIAAKRKDQKV